MSKQVSAQAAAASASKVANADKGPRSSLEKKLRQIADYILREAEAKYEGDYARVPCPDETEWNRLALSEKHPFPSVTVLNMYKNESLTAIAAKTRGGIRVASFNIARRWIRKEKESADRAS